jgi:hypothetical protein
LLLLLLLLLLVVVVWIRCNGGLKLGRSRLCSSVRVVGIEVLALAQGVVHGVVGHVVVVFTRSPVPQVATSPHHTFVICTAGTVRGNPANRFLGSERQVGGRVAARQKGCHRGLVDIELFWFITGGVVVEQVDLSSVECFDRYSGLIIQVG